MLAKIAKQFNVPLQSWASVKSLYYQQQQKKSVKEIKWHFSMAVHM